MPEARRADVAEIVKSAFERDSSERARYLDQACGPDTDLRAEVESLLNFGERAPRFMDEPAVHLAADLLAENETLQPNERLDQYEICSLIGSGGMGEVYLARDTELGRNVALKLVKSGLGTANIIRHFHQEERILAGLNHPHIARLYGGGVTPQGVPYFIMEYVEGERLDEYCNNRRLTTCERLNLFRKVCLAVTYAHQHLVIHRDLKPANIRVTAEGEPKLLDFGIAKLLDPETQRGEQTVTLATVMTPEYASPEQVRGESMTTSSDVYTLGVVLYELLTGSRPYRVTSRTPNDISRAITDQEPVRPSLVPPGGSEFRDRRSLRGDLDNIILMAMRKEPSRRYSSVAQFSEDIRRHLDDLPLVARKDTFTYRASKFIARNKVSAAAATLVFFAIITGLTASIWQARVAARERDQARLKTAQAEELNSFLQSILSAASPEEKGKDATVIDVLNDATKRIEAEFATQPELRARALTTIGRTYALLGLPDKAEWALREAVRLNISLYGERNSATALSMLYLGNILLFSPQTNAEAGALILKGLATERALSPSGSKDLAFALFNAGEFYNRSSEFPKARSALQESVAMSQLLFGERNPDYAFALMSLGRADEFSSDLIRAEANYRKAIALFRELPRRNAQKMAVALSNLGRMLIVEDRDDEALPLLREADHVFQTQGENVFLVFSKGLLCKAYWTKGDYESAVVAGTTAIELVRKLHIAETFDIIHTREYLGMSLTRAGHANEAEPFSREALDTTRKWFAKFEHGSESVAIAEGALGECLAAQGRFDEAEPLIVHSHDILKAFSGVSIDTPSGKLDLYAKWRALARKRAVDLYEKWQKPDLAAKYRATP
jgi:eukaryotic-like serine/threonine-protein kinase